tara:strand:- start:9691 stop:10416 length:726 start_codon:yes stop_codon:yes gene_type:complete
MNSSIKTTEMNISYDFFEATFIERPNRFITRVKLNSEIIDSHLPDPGRLTELLIPGAKLLLKAENSPKRKTQFSTQAVLFNNIIISLNTLIPNKFVSYLIKNKSLYFLSDWSFKKQEITYGHSRFDFQVQNNKKTMIIEVKSVTLVENKIAKFPDAVTKRGKKHVDHLGELASQGVNAMILFVVQRHDVKKFKPQWDIDPQFSQSLLDANRKGVNIHVIKMKMTYKAFIYKGEIPFDLEKK